MTLKTRIFHDPEFQNHRHAPGHPESPERLQAVVSALLQRGYEREMTMSPPATFEELCAAHDSSYVQSIAKRTLQEADEETPVYANTFRIASLAAGAAISALNTSMDEGCGSLALVRPPGHHASSGKGGGFCYFNNVAVAARHQPTRRFAIVDIDVHHGNGTSEIFYDDPSVLYVSTHQDGIYPGTGHLNEIGSGKGEWHNLNIPLPAGSGDATFDMAFEEVIMPVLSSYSPDGILVSLGADAHYMDPLASLTLSTSGYVRCIDRLMALERPIAVVLEGGYNPGALADVIAGTLHALDGKEYCATFAEVSDLHCAGKDAVKEASFFFSEYWGTV